MDIILKPIVSFIQDLDGMSNAILAGGAVRDKMFGLEPRDYDIFVPARDKKALYEAVAAISKEFSTSEVVSKSKEYGIRDFTIGNRIEGTSLTAVLNFKYKDRDIDIIGVHADDDEEFPVKTIETFDYGINMVYDTGRYIDDSHSKFRRDFDNHYMTLHRLDSLDRLPKAMRRFESFNSRIQEAHGYQFYFDSTMLRIERPKEVLKKEYLTKSKYYLDEAVEAEQQEDWASPVIVGTHAFTTNAGAHTHNLNVATTATGIAAGAAGTINTIQQFNNLINNN